MIRLTFFLICSVLTMSSFAQAVTNSAVPQQETPAAPAQIEPVEEEQEESKSLEEISIQSKKKAEKSSGAVIRSAASEDILVEDQKGVRQEQFMLSRQSASYQRTQRTPSVEQQQIMDDAVTYFEQRSPESFEYHYFKYLSGNHDVSLRSHLLEAEVLRPENSDVHIQLVAMKMIESDKESAKDYLQKLSSSGRLPNSSVSYAEDVLNSCPEGTVLLSHAFEDTYSLWYQQLVNGTRNDVKIISLDLLQSEAYRTKLKAEGYAVPDLDIIGIAFAEAFLRMNSNKTTALAMTIPKEYFTSLLPDLFVQGLTFAYDPLGKLTMNNVDLWNNALQKHLLTKAKDDKGKQLSANYLPVMLSVREHYVSEGNTEQVEVLDQEIAKIVVQSKKQTEFSKLSE